MNELNESHSPRSKDPEFWDVWINKEDRNINWEEIADDWQEKGKSLHKLNE